MSAMATPLADFRHTTLPRLADGLAVAVAVSLPWSTSATGILVAAWLLACLPTLDLAALHREVRAAPGGLPVLLVALALAGLTWADAPAVERFRGVEPFLRLLMIPVLFAQYRRSERGLWVAAGFLLSDAVLLALSWAMIAFGWNFGHTAGVPVKDYIIQSGAFALCAFALLDVGYDRWADGRCMQAAACAALALAFIANIVYVTTGRTTLVVIPVMFVMFGLRRLSWTAFAGFLLAGVVFAAAVWTTSAYVRQRAASVFTEIAATRDSGADTSAGERLAFWRESLATIAQAPILGHGTGTIQEMFRRRAAETSSPTAANPHNEIFTIGIQLGAVGIALLLAMWAVHWRMFLAPGLAGWIGLLAVTQNIVGSLFNSHLMDFTQAWLYVFAVGVFGGMVLRHHEADAPAAAPLPSPSR
jgi:O-antigen ligase